jgi:hypothetical protein
MKEGGLVMRHQLHEDQSQVHLESFCKDFVGDVELCYRAPIVEGITASTLVQ